RWPGTRPTSARTASRRPPGARSRASRASARSAARWERSPSRRPCTPRRDPAFGRGPARVEGMSGLVEVDQQRRVVGWDGLTLARLAVDLRPQRAPGDRRRGEQVIDAHADVLVEVAGAVVPP